MGKRLLKAGGECIRGEFASLRIRDRGSVSSVGSGVIRASRRFKEDAEAKVQPKKNFEDIPKFLVFLIMQA